MKILETFQIKGHGLLVIVDQPTDFPYKKLAAKITRPDGKIVFTQAFQELPLRTDPSAPKNDAFLIIELSKNDVPIGSDIEFEVTMSAPLPT
jgi:hypothetical protein